VFADGEIGDFEFLLTSLHYAPCLRSDGDVLVHLTLPHEIEVELSTILQPYLSGLFLIYEELSEFET
jgi:hypothetical protein